jgi:hypothetical protein
MRHARPRWALVGGIRCETKRLIGNFPQALSYVALIAYQFASQTR